MSVADDGINLLAAVLAAPAVAALMAGLVSALNIINKGANIEGGGKFANLQESIYSTTIFIIDLLQFASSLEMLVLVSVFILSIVSLLGIGGDRGGF